MNRLPGVDDCLPPSKRYTGATIFDTGKYNDDVTVAIQKFKSENNASFSDEFNLDFNDLPTLLQILLETLLGEIIMDRTACASYLSRHSPLIESLFARMPPQVAKHLQLTYSGLNNHSLKGAFEEKYRGDAAKLFIMTLDMAFGTPATKAPYNWSVPVVQSSGTGKSRMVDESGNTVFTFPVNIREDLPDGRLTYPPPDKEIRSFFTDCRDASDEQQLVNYAIFLRTLFIIALELVQRLFPGLVGEELALSWVNYLKEARKPRSRKEAIRSATSAGQGLQYLESSLRESCDRFMRLIQATSTDTKNACFMYFDEAHSLTRAVDKPIENMHQRSQYHNLGTVLSKLVDQKIFFIFLSTNSRLNDLAPTRNAYPPDRVVDGSQLIPPFNELPFDIYEESVLDSVGPLTPENMCKTDAIVGFGRPLWHAYRTSHPTRDVFSFAINKLCASGVLRHKDDSHLAALGVRVGFVFNETDPTASSTQSRLVERHLRIIHSIPRSRECMHTGSPSEPVLAEAAGRYLNSSGRRGVTIEGPERLSLALKRGLLASEDRIDLAGRLLVTSAYDLALNATTPPPPLEPHYHRPIPVLSFLRALFHQDYHELILTAKSLTRRFNIDNLSTAFTDAYLFFSHFAPAEDSEMLSSFGLATALVRGMALQAKDCQESIDLVLPIHMGPLTAPISPETTSAINLQIKNRKFSENFVVDRTITVPNLDLPIISIIFEFGVTGNRQVPIHISENIPPNTHQESNVHPNDHHYQIVAHGCSSAVFAAIPPETESQYQMILGGRTALQDFPRKSNPENLDAFLQMKSTFSAERQRECYTKRV